MPKNKKKGKKRPKQNTVKRQLTFKENMQEYAKITKLLGDRRLMVVLPDGSEIMAIIPGRFRKRLWMKIGDVILIARRGFQEDKTDVIHKYTQDEVRKLINMYEIPSTFVKSVDISDIKEDENLDIIFQDIDIDLI